MDFWFVSSTQHRDDFTCGLVVTTCEQYVAVLLLVWSVTWDEHAGEALSMSHPQDVLKGTELQTPHCPSQSVGHVGFGHGRGPHVSVHLHTHTHIHTRVRVRDATDRKP